MKPTCDDCGELSDSPMYKDEVWLSVFPSKRGYLCVDCFEKRLGRPITRHDLNNSLWSKVLLKLVERVEAGTF